MSRSAATLVLVLLALVACKDERAAAPASPPAVAPAVVHDALPIDTAVDVTAKGERELSLVDYEHEPVTLEAELAR